MLLANKDSSKRLHEDFISPLRGPRGQKLKVPHWSSGCLGVQKGSLGGVTGDFEALDNVSNACPVLGRGAGIIELF